MKVTLLLYRASRNFAEKARPSQWGRADFERIENKIQVLVGGMNVHDSSHRFGSAITRCLAGLAVQSILGLLPERRFGPGRSCALGSTARRPFVKAC